MHSSRESLSLGKAVIAVGFISALGACTGAKDSAAPAAAPLASALPPPVASGEPAAPSTVAATKPLPPAPAAIQKAAFGKHEDKDVELYTLTNKNGLVLKATTYGATVTELFVPDRQGKLADVVLGFDTLQGYEGGTAYFGATVGRVANRIRGAKFSLDGKAHQLGVSDPPHALHGGVKGWDKVVWKAEAVESADGPAIVFSYVSKDGEEGFPGNVTARTTYTLTHKNELKVVMEATTDQPTLVNMAHHSYWNLAGFDSGNVLEHELTLFADKYTPGDPMVPTGAVKAVKGTPFDFTAKKPVGRDLKAVGGKPVGYDHNFVVDGEPHALRPVARLYNPKSGRVLTLEADQPGVQFYSGNFLDGKARGKGASYAQYSGLCLETQAFPNSINVPAWKDQVILRPGQTYKHTMVHAFSVE
ncbi:MAG: aldose epimerase family protein [Polyangiaceae bacterium]